METLSLDDSKVRWGPCCGVESRLQHLGMWGTVQELWVPLGRVPAGACVGQNGLSQERVGEVSRTLSLRLALVIVQQDS